MNKKNLLTAAGLGLAGFGLSSVQADDPVRPNIIICLSDDQGWGEVAYNEYGYPQILTPTLDEMAASGMRFDRFYAQQMCSPARASILTGRNPVRMSCYVANNAFRPEEVTIAEAVKTVGYTTGLFGKWHVGPAKTNRPCGPTASGFDEWLAMDNYFDIDPNLSLNGAYPQQYIGESSEIVMDAALDFIRQSVSNEQPFLSMIWFGSPHWPYEASAEDQQVYVDMGMTLNDGKTQRFTEITQMDEDIGRLRVELQNLNIASNTMLWFLSDNGAPGNEGNGGLRGAKKIFYEGGIRVPCLLEWPDSIPNPVRTDIPCSVMDIYPTVVDLLGLTITNQVYPMDGISLRDLFAGQMTSRFKPIPFAREEYSDVFLGDPSDPGAATGNYAPCGNLQGWAGEGFEEGRNFQNVKRPYVDHHVDARALIDNRYKLVRENRTDPWELYDLIADQNEETNLISVLPAVAASMQAQMDAWAEECYRSSTGLDYDDDNDGLPGWWEIDHFGGETNANPNATASNAVNTVLEAYIAGLDPADPDAAFLISDIQPQTSGSVLSWNATNGRAYTVSWSSNLLSGFQALERNIAYTAVPYTDTNHTADGQGFYKIEVTME